MKFCYYWLLSCGRVFGYLLVLPDSLKLVIIKEKQYGIAFSFEITQPDVFFCAWFFINCFHPSIHPCYKVWCYTACQSLTWAVFHVWVDFSMCTIMYKFPRYPLFLPQHNTHTHTRTFLPFPSSKHSLTHTAFICMCTCLHIIYSLQKDVREMGGIKVHYEKI